MAWPRGILLVVVLSSVLSPGLAMRSFSLAESEAEAGAPPTVFLARRLRDDLEQVRKAVRESSVGKSKKKKHNIRVGIQDERSRAAKKAVRTSFRRLIISLRNSERNKASSLYADLVFTVRDARYIKEIFSPALWLEELLVRWTNIEEDDVLVQEMSLEYAEGLAKFANIVEKRSSTGHASSGEEDDSKSEASELDEEQLEMQRQFMEDLQKAGIIKRPKPKPRNAPRKVTIRERADSAAVTTTLAGKL